MATSPIPIQAEWLDAVRQIVLDAGSLVLSRQEDDLWIEQKSAANYVTEIDLAVERLVVGRLARLEPDFAMITEESDGACYDISRPTWILDPVDGTTNLMRHYRHSAISLALAADGRTRLGFIYNPYAGELFSAAEGRGADLNGRRIAVSRHSDLADGLIGFGTTPYARTDAHQTFTRVESVFMHALEIRRSGSAALDLAYVACGRLDGFFELMLQPWDYAAGNLILREAGGAVTNWQGLPPSLARPDSILASNGLLHGQLAALIY